MAVLLDSVACYERSLHVDTRSRLVVTPSPTLLSRRRQGWRAGLKALLAFPVGILFASFTPLSLWYRPWFARSATRLLRAVGSCYPDGSLRLTYPRSFFVVSMLSVMHLSECVEHALVQGTDLGVMCAVRTIFLHFGLNRAALQLLYNGSTLTWVTLIALGYFAAASDDGSIYQENPTCVSAAAGTSLAAAAAFVLEAAEPLCPAACPSGHHVVWERHEFHGYTVAERTMGVLVAVAVLRIVFYETRRDKAHTSRRAWEVVQRFAPPDARDEVRSVLQSTDWLIAAEALTILVAPLESTAVALVLFTFVDTPGGDVEASVVLTRQGDRRSAPVPEAPQAKQRQLPALREAVYLSALPNPCLRYGEPLRRVLAERVVTPAFNAVVNATLAWKRGQASAGGAPLLRETAATRAVQDLFADAYFRWVHCELFLLSGVVDAVGRAAVPQGQTLTDVVEPLRLLGFGARTAEALGGSDAAVAEVLEAHRQLAYQAIFTYACNEVDLCGRAKHCLDLERTASRSAAAAAASSTGDAPPPPRPDLGYLVQVLVASPAGEVDALGADPSRFSRELLCPRRLVAMFARDTRAWCALAQRLLRSVDVRHGRGLGGVDMRRARGTWTLGDKGWQQEGGDSAADGAQTPQSQPPSDEELRRDAAAERDAYRLVDRVGLAPLVLLQAFSHKGWRCVERCVEGGDGVDDAERHYARQWASLARDMSLHDALVDVNVGRDCEDEPSGRVYTEVMSYEEDAAVRVVRAAAVNLQQVLLRHWMADLSATEAPAPARLTPLPSAYPAAVLRKACHVMCARYWGQQMSHSSLHATIFLANSVVGALRSTLGVEAAAEFFEVELGAKAEHYNPNGMLLRSPPFYQLLHLLLCSIHSTLQAPHGTLFIHGTLQCAQSIVASGLPALLAAVGTANKLVLKLGVVVFATITKYSELGLATLPQAALLDITIGLGVINAIASKAAGTEHLVHLLTEAPDVLSRIFGTLVSSEDARVQAEAKALLDTVETFRQEWGDQVAVETPPPDGEGPPTAAEAAQPAPMEQVTGVEDVCCICLSEIAPTDAEVTRLQCGHHFHELCVKVWFYSNSVCPQCRRKI